jgi:hypothetical protein
MYVSSESLHHGFKAMLHFKVKSPRHHDDATKAHDYFCGALHALRKHENLCQTDCFLLGCWFFSEAFDISMDSVSSFVLKLNQQELQASPIRQQGFTDFFRWYKALRGSA